MRSLRTKDNSNRSRSTAHNFILFPAVALAAGLIAYAGATIRTAKADDTAKPSRTTEQGVYTDDQATQGKDVYSQNCATCHLDDLSGSGQALPLAGDSFLQSWEGQTVDDLFEVIHDTMPQDKPGTLTPDQAVEVVSYLLKFNKFPSGTTALKSDPVAMKDILITTKKPAASGAGAQ